MVNELVIPHSTILELATFGEVLYAFSVLRSTSRRRGSTSTANKSLPWETAAGTTADFQVPVAPRDATPPPPPRADPAQPARATRARRASGRCHCRQCRNCQENARWERIFQEKFASSDYYHQDIRVRYASPLSGV
jgi:hypothetical protein